MLKFPIVLFFSATAFLPLAAAQAQDQNGVVSPPDASELQEYEDFVIPQLGLKIGRIENMPVIGPKGAKIGEAEEVLVDSRNQPVAITIEIGGFLGIGEYDVVVSLDKVGVQADREKLTLTMTREQLEQLPEWND